MRFRAVAENQPGTTNQNRMTSDLSAFSAQLRRFVHQRQQPGLIIVGTDTFCGCEADFNALALELYSLQFTHNPAYRRFCAARSASPASVRFWRDIPAIPSSAFKELELSCLPAPERTVVFHSSGTTEHRPSRHFHNTDSLAVYEASLWPWFQAHVLPGMDAGVAPPRLLILTPPPADAPHSSLVHMFDSVRQHLAAAASSFVGTSAADNTWTVDVASAIAALDGAARTGQPLIVLGTAFSFVQLLDALAVENRRFDLPRGSRAMETGGYKGRSRELPKAELHRLISRRLGIPASRIVCEYGMSELSSQAYDLAIAAPNTGELERPERRFRFPPWARSLVVSPETGAEVAEGETGLLRVFDLANVGSVMAIQTEDLAIRSGRGFGLAGRASMAEPRGCSLMAVR
jgi:hypothetical protein